MAEQTLPQASSSSGDFSTVVLPHCFGPKADVHNQTKTGYRTRITSSTETINPYPSEAGQVLLSLNDLPLGSSILIMSSRKKTSFNFVNKFVVHAIL